jgi:CheY-like chemotaxis protein
MHDAKPDVLIVEDEAGIRTTMSLVLQESGYHVRFAQDGFSALREIRQQTPGILLSDLNMPGMSGFELLLVVRRRFPEIQVVAMSGAFSGDEVPSGIPADAFYQKGSSSMALLQIFMALPQTKLRAPALPRAASPLWIQHGGDGASAQAFVIVTCPECRRSLSQPLDLSGCLMREVNCIHCGSPIQYSIIDPADQMPPQGFRPDPRAALAAQRSRNLSY